MYGIDDFLRDTFVSEKEYIERGGTLIAYRYIQRPRIYCFDGFHISVQGNDGVYCSPRKYVKYYTEMELGYPSKKEESILEYAEEPKAPTKTVYGHVPIDVIKKMIIKHNGINIKKTYKDWPYRMIMLEREKKLKKILNIK